MIFFSYNSCTETVKWLQRAQIMHLSEVDVSNVATQLLQRARALCDPGWRRFLSTPVGFQPGEKN